MHIDLQIHNNKAIKHILVIARDEIFQRICSELTVKLTTLAIIINCYLLFILFVLENTE